jgi:hypothetical protein
VQDFKPCLHRGELVLRDNLLLQICLQFSSVRLGLHLRSLCLGLSSLCLGLRACCAIRISIVQQVAQETF